MTAAISEVFAGPGCHGGVFPVGRCTVWAGHDSQRSASNCPSLARKAASCQTRSSECLLRWEGECGFATLLLGMYPSAKNTTVYWLIESMFTTCGTSSAHVAPNQPT